MTFDRLPHAAPQPATVRDVRDVHDAIVSAVQAFDRDHAHRVADAELQRLELALARQSQFIAGERSRALRLDVPAHAPIHGEVRQHLRTLTDEQRDALLADALERADTDTLYAAMLGPGYLSGLTRDRQAELRASMALALNGERLAELAEAERIAERTRAALDAARVHIERAREPAQEAA